MQHAIDNVNRIFGELSPSELKRVIFLLQKREPGLLKAIKREGRRVTLLEKCFPVASAK